MTEEERKELTRLKRRATFGSAIIYSTIVTFVVGVALAIGGIAYVRANNRILCPLLNEVADFYQDSPPDPTKMDPNTYDRAVKLGKIYADMQIRYGCTTE